MIMVGMPLGERIGNGEWCQVTRNIYLTNVQRTAAARGTVGWVVKAQ